MSLTISMSEGGKEDTVRSHFQLVLCGIPMLAWLWRYSWRCQLTLSCTPSQQHELL